MNLLTVCCGRNSESLVSLQKNTHKGYGYFYIVEFSVDLVKIGCTRHPASRIEQLSGTIAKEIGLPIKRIAISGQCKFFRRYEAEMHKIFDDSRVPRSELFKVSFDTALNAAIRLTDVVNQRKNEETEYLRNKWVGALNHAIRAGNISDAVKISFIAGMDTAEQLNRLEL